MYRKEAMELLGSSSIVHFDENFNLKQQYEVKNNEK